MVITVKKADGSEFTKQDYLENEIQKLMLVQIASGAQLEVIEELLNDGSLTEIEKKNATEAYAKAKTEMNGNEKKLKAWMSVYSSVV